MDNIELAKAIASLPLTVLLALVLVGGYVEWWVYGTIHRAQITALENRMKEAQESAEKWETRYMSSRRCTLDECPLENHRTNQPPRT